MGELPLAVEVGHRSREDRPHPAHADAVSRHEQGDVGDGEGKEDEGQGDCVGHEEELGGHERGEAVADPAPGVFAEGPEERGQAHEGHGRVGIHAAVHETGLELAQHAAEREEGHAEGRADDPQGPAVQQIAPAEGGFARLQGRVFHGAAGQAVRGEAEIGGLVAHDEPADGEEQEGEAAEQGVGPRDAHALDEQQGREGQEGARERSAHVDQPEGPPPREREPAVHEHGGHDAPAKLAADPDHREQPGEEPQLIHMAEGDVAKPSHEGAEGHDQADADVVCEDNPERHAQGHHDGSKAHRKADTAPAPAVQRRERLDEGVHHVEDASLNEQISA